MDRFPDLSRLRSHAQKEQEEVVKAERDNALAKGLSGDSEYLDYIKKRAKYDLDLALLSSARASFAVVDVLRRGSATKDEMQRMIPSDMLVRGDTSNLAELEKNVKNGTNVTKLLKGIDFAKYARHERRWRATKDAVRGAIGGSSRKRKSSRKMLTKRVNRKRRNTRVG